MAVSDPASTDLTRVHQPQYWYYVRMEVNLYAHTYSVFVRPGGGGGTPQGPWEAYRSPRTTRSALSSRV